MSTRPFYQSVVHAIEGVHYALKHELHMRLHCVAAGVALCMGVVLDFNAITLAVLWLTIILVLVTEMVNTAIEAAMDFSGSGELHPLIKVVKDLAAGAVLLASGNAVVIGALIFVPHFAGQALFVVPGIAAIAVLGAVSVLRLGQEKSSTHISRMTVHKPSTLGGQPR